ncbi:hypothetical protein A0H81_00425 [Grifola frondosa]|uniref:Uncharacterized protein n=1 Tax=Grifola frondosa TaxID=5627 RepID=A0A1C7MY53_GRIFR|nr:hypothetical protein A0H81_00425 [Grifola frondosa]
MTPGSFTKHSRVCPKRKKRSAGALARVQELWASKRQRQDDSMPPEAQGVKTKTHTFGPLSSPLDAARVFDSASTTLYDLDARWQSVGPAEKIVCFPSGIET